MTASNSTFKQQTQLDKTPEIASRTAIPTPDILSPSSMLTTAMNNLTTPLEKPEETLDATNC